MALKILAEIAANAVGFKTVLKQTESQAASWGRGIAKTVAAAFAIDRIRAFAESQKEVVEQAQQLELALGSVRKILDKGAFEGVGGPELEKFAAAVREAASGGKDPFKQLGVSVRNVGGELKSNEQILREFAAEIQNAESQSAKLAAAVDVVGIKKAGAFVRTLEEVNLSSNTTFDTLQNQGTLALSGLAGMTEKAMSGLKKLARAAAGVVLAPLAVPGEFRDIGRSFREASSRQDEERKRQLAEEEAMLLEFYESELAAAERVKAIREEIAKIDRDAAMKKMTDEEKMVMLQNELWDIAKRGARDAEEAAQNELDFKRKQAELDAFGAQMNKAAAMPSAGTSPSSVNQLQRIGAQVGNAGPKMENIAKQQLVVLKQVASNTSRQSESIPA